LYLLCKDKFSAEKEEFALFPRLSRMMVQKAIRMRSPEIDSD
jgi:hypothetical protein